MNRPHRDITVRIVREYENLAMTDEATGKGAMARIKSSGFIIALALLAPAARAGDCKIENIDGRSVQTCDNGYVETRDGRRTHAYGVRNGGVGRYPGHAPPPWALERQR